MKAMTDLGTCLALEDDVFAVPTDAPTAAVHVQVLGARAVDIVLVVFLIVFGIIRGSDNRRGSCCGATAGERGNERWRLSLGIMQALHKATRQ